MLGHEVVLAELVERVESMGGAGVVTAKRQWRLVARSLGFKLRGKTYADLTYAAVC